LASADNARSSAGTLGIVLNIGPGEMLVICVVLLLAVGPEQLPGLIRKIGNLAAQVRSMTDSFRSDFMSGVEELEQATNPKKWSEDPFNPDSFGPKMSAVAPSFDHEIDAEDDLVESQGDSSESNDDEATAENEVFIEEDARSDERSAGDTEPREESSREDSV